ncbi:CAMK protein kinase [Polytolypa hystricis UAMH7299]|uniref:CAMK protein kinase n=1 Tax=Polytolypa hystricis (strain UAMH7299) TaxID=1447883 RepID=A0A2B7Y0Z1_POLH7|nr:CAMK protein kinase [Polytolypa hystricis UAMH7299]
MAHEEARFASLSLEADFIPPLNDKNSSIQESRSQASSKDVRGSPGEGAGTRTADQGVLNELHTPTPPISVPLSEEHHAGPATDELEYSHNPRYAEPSPLEQFAIERRPSVAFDPEVRLDTGERRAPKEVLEGPGHISGMTTSSKATSGLQQIDTRQPYRFPSDALSLAHQRKTAAPRQIYFSPTNETLSNNSTSLTSLSTASPVTEELRTPPDTQKEAFFSAYSAYSASPTVHRPSFSEDPTGWGILEKQPFETQPRSYTFGRNSSLRRPNRPSRRSSNFSGKSPASNFLSLWNRDESPPLPDDEGQVVGSDYVIGKQIGFGGFSTVKEAFRVKGDGGPERFAVKIVKRELNDITERENDQAQAEFDHEVRIWRYLNHPHILPLVAVYETDYATFCFTHMTTGGTLFDLVRRNRQGLGMSNARQYAYQLASAIRYLHEDARVVHRDIKLENCLLDRPVSEDEENTPRLILCDFGMSEWVTTDNGSSSPDPYDNAADRPPPRNIGPADTSTSVAGSLEYASPELLLSSNGVINPVVDMWAFGVIIYALLVGTRPFQHPFQPRVRTNILAGAWDKDAVLKSAGGDEREKQDALELIRGCLEMDPVKRWTISEALGARWFDRFSESLEEAASGQGWAF